MSFTIVNKYKDHWILTSAERVQGGGTIDAPPVRLVDLADRRRLAQVLKEVLAENHPIVPEPDWNETRFTVGIRVEALGLNSWRSFAREARAFKVEERPEGLLLEEWPKEGGSFSAKPSWRKEFPPNRLQDLVDYLVECTEPAESQRTARIRKTASRRSRRC